MDIPRDKFFAQRLKRQNTYLNHRTAVERQKLEKELTDIKLQRRRRNEALTKSARRLEDEIWRREAEEEETDSEDDVGVVDGIYADESEQMFDLPSEATEIGRRLSDISLSGGTAPARLSLPVPERKNKNNSTSASSAPRLTGHSLGESRGQFKRSEYLAIPKRFSAKLSPSMTGESDVIVTNQPQRILTYRIFIPRGNEAMIASEPVYTKTKRKLLFAREARTKSAPPVCSWGKFTEDAKERHLTSNMCQYDVTTQKCTKYPCNMPLEYNSLGFDVDHDRPNRFKMANQLSTKARHRLIKHLENESVRRPLRSSVEKTTNREKALKVFIWQMKTRTQTGRPKEWVTNYGAPISSRKVNAAVKSF